MTYNTVISGQSCIAYWEIVFGDRVPLMINFFAASFIFFWPHSPYTVLCVSPACCVEHAFGQLVWIAWFMEFYWFSFTFHVFCWMSTYCFLHLCVNTNLSPLDISFIIIIYHNLERLCKICICVNFPSHSIFVQENYVFGLISYPMDETFSNFKCRILTFTTK